MPSQKVAESYVDLEMPANDDSYIKRGEDEKAYLETMSRHFRLKELHVKRKKDRKRLFAALLELGLVITAFLIAGSMIGSLGVVARVIGIFVITVIFTLLYQPLFFDGYGTNFRKRKPGEKLGERILDRIEEVLFKRV